MIGVTNIFLVHADQLGRPRINIFEALYFKITRNNMETSFPYICIALRIFLSMMVTNCTGERYIK